MPLYNTPALPPVFSHRERLRDRLDAAGDRCIVVRAPGGSGKTTTVVDWVRSRRVTETTAWLTAQGDVDDTGFWYRLARALDRVSSGDEALQDLLRGLIPVHDAHTVVTSILNTPQGPDRLVIDDAHLIPDSAARAIIWMLGHLTRTQIVIVSRRRGPFESPSAIARFAPVVITGDDLAFDLEETGRVVDAVISDGTPRPQYSPAELREATNGHPLSTRIALAFLSDRSTLSTAAVAHLAAEDILPARSSERDIALRIALARAVDADLSTLLSDHPDPAPIVRGFAREGLGDYSNEGFFTFHAIVQDAFLRLAEKEFSPGDKADVRRIAAEYLGRHEDWAVTAMHLACEAQDADLIWALYVTHFTAIMNHFRTPVLKQVDAVPRLLLIRHGGAACALAALRGEDERRPSIESLSLADGALESVQAMPVPTDPAARFRRDFILFAGHRAVRRYAEAAAQGEELFAQALRMRPLEREALATPIAIGTLQTIVVHVLSSHFDRAEELLAYLRDRNPERAMHGIAVHAFVHAASGRMRESSAVLTQLPGTRVERWQATAVSIGWHLARVLDAVENADSDNALTQLRDIGQTMPMTEYWPYVLWAEALASLLAEDVVLGRDRLRRALQDNRDRVAADAPRALLLAAAADLELACGDTLAALTLLDEAPTQEHPAIVLTRARIALASDDPATARVLAVRALRTPGIWARHRTQAHLVLAVALARQGRRHVARRTLLRAVAHADEQRQVTPFVLFSRAELERIMGEEIPLLGNVHAYPFADAADLRLTRREREVLNGLSREESLTELSSRLFVSRNTIKSQAHSIYRKLGVSSRKEAVETALRLRIIDLDDPLDATE